MPVLCSLLGFLAVYWLCKELSASALMGWLTMSFYAVSPIFLRYSQEVRQYSLVLSLFIFSSAILLRAIRNKKKRNWVLYSLLMSISYYCQPISLLTLISHGVYLLIMEKSRLSKNVVSFLISAIVSGLLFSPWIYIICTNLGTIKGTTSWMADSTSLLTTYKFWSINLSRAFFGLHFQNNQIAFFSAPIIILLISYAFSFLARHGSKSLSVFVFSISGVAFFPFLINDILDAGTRTSTPRFFLPCYLGIYLAVSFLLSTKISTCKRRFFVAECYSSDSNRRYCFFRI